MKSLDCFAGIGGFALGMSWAGIETIGFVEADEKAQLVLKKNFPGVPIHGDIRTFDATQYRGKVQIVSGGFPCQPWSGAGHRRGHLDDRDLWEEMLSVIRNVKAPYFLGENVQGFVNKEMGLQRATTDLEREGFQTRNFLLPACSVNAPHQRYRIFIVGYSKHNGSSSAEECGNIVEAGKRGEEESKQTVQLEGTGGQGCDETLAYSECDTKRSAQRKGTQQSSNGEQNNGNEIRDDLGNGSKVLAYSESGKSRLKEAGDRRENSSRGSKKLGKVLAYPDSRGCTSFKQTRGGKEKDCRGENDPKPSGAIAGSERSARVQLGGSFNGVSPELDGSINSWADGWEDGIPRVEVGVKGRSTRLKQLGNSVVPQLVYMICDSILRADRDE